MKQSLKTSLTPYLLLVLSLLIVSCNTDNDDPEKECIDHFSYDNSAIDGPEFWNQYCVDDGTENQCKSTERQSPINITGAIDNPNLEVFTTNYLDSTTEIINNGHTIQFNYKGNAKLTFNEIEYSLLQFHFHVDSEHTVNGQFSPLEVHLVHASSGGDLAVVGVFFELGAENSFLAQFMGNLPELKDETHTESATYNAESLLPSSKNYFTYSGSLTTPPCSEIVNWIVMENPIEASQEQLNAFSTILVKNNRPVQPLGNREIKRFVQ